MKSLASAGVVAAALASEAMALGQPTAPPAPEPNSSTIVVEGTRNRDKQINQFIKSLTPAPVGGQLSRFETSVCPAAIGLQDRQNAYIAERMRRIADAAGLAVGKAACHPNVILIVTRDKRALLRRLKKERPDYFPADWSSWDIGDLERDSSPVAAWQIKGQFLADNRPESHDSVSSTLDVRTLPRTIEPGSRLKPATRWDFLASVVVVQADALAGLTTMQLADYAAMRTFVQTDPKQLRGSNPNTILSVIDAPMGTEVPISITDWDMSFLKAFYASGNNSYASYQRSEMRRLMKRNLDRAQQAEPPPR